MRPAGRIYLFRRICVMVLHLLIIFLPRFSHADTTERIVDFHSSISVYKDSSLAVVEKITVRCEGIKIKHGIYRDFPTTHTDSKGTSHQAGFKVFEVKRDDRPEPYRIERTSDGERVYIGDRDVFLDAGEYTYTLAYKTSGHIGFFKEFDELYWNVTGNDWEFPIDRASVMIRLPAGAAKKIISMSGYTGFKGEAGKDYTHTNSRGTASFFTTRPLNAGAGFTIAVSWPKGYVTEPSPPPSETVNKPQTADYDAYIRETRIKYSIPAAAGLLVLLAYYLFVWFRVGKDPRQNSVVVQYVPPRNLSPAAMRYISRMGYDDKVFSSAMVNLAVGGHVAISENGGEYTVSKKTGGPGPASPEENEIREKLLGSQITVRLRRANGALIKKTAWAVEDLLKKTYKSAYFTYNRKALFAGIIITLVIGAVSGYSISRLREEDILWPGIVLVWQLGLSLVSLATVNWREKVFRRIIHRTDCILTRLVVFYYTIPVVLLITGWKSAGFSVLLSFLAVSALFINHFFAHLLKTPTADGRKLLDHIEGFKRFLAATEEDRLNMMNPPEKTPLLFEKYLPYALALDVEQKWAEQFSDILADASSVDSPSGYSPSWHSGAFAPEKFAYAFSGALADSCSASSRSGSGSYGGGSSGGGRGGGGGGGW